MNRLPTRPNQALVHRGPDEVIAQAPFRVENETGWTGVREVLGIFRRHVWLIAIFTAIGVAGAGYFVSQKVPKYSASAIVRLLNRAGQTSTLEEPLGGTYDPVLSEIIVLTGRTVLGRAVDREGFRLFSTDTQAPSDIVASVGIGLPPEETGTITLEFTENGVKYGPANDPRIVEYGAPIHLNGATFSVPSRPSQSNVMLRVVPQDVAIDYLASGLLAEPNSATGGVTVTFTSTEQWIGPRAVNAIVEEYQKVNAEMAKQNIRLRREFIEKQLRETDSLLMIAQANLSGLRTSTQSYSAAGRFSAEQGNLMQVEMQQAQLQAELRMAENMLSRITQARTAGQSADLSAMMSLPGIGGDPIVGQLFSQLMGFRAEREGLLAGVWARAPTHPDVQRLDILIGSTEDRLINAVQSYIGSLQAQIGALGGLRGRALAKMSDLPQTEVQEVFLTQNVEALQVSSDNLRDEYQEVRLEEASEAGLVEIIQLSTRALPLSSSSWVVLLLGLAVGLMLGCGAAVGREMFDDSISTPNEIEDILLLPNLAVIPAASTHLIDPGSNGGSRPAGLESPGTEAYRILRTNLLFSHAGLKTLVVTSAAPGEGKTMTSVNLAAAYARQGLKVLLLECDLRRPALGKYFENTLETDLADVLFEKRDWREAVQPTKLSGLYVLLAGGAIPRAAEFLGGDEMKGLLGELSREFDIVILDTSPLLVAADATVLGAIVDGVLLVVRATRTDRGAVEQAVHQLALVGANVVGTVLNDPDGTASRYRNYYDYSTEYEVG